MVTFTFAGVDLILEIGTEKLSVSTSTVIFCEVNLVVRIFLFRMDV